MKKLENLFHALSTMMSKKRGGHMYPIGAILVILYFSLGYLTEQWDKVWLVFLLQPILVWHLTRSKEDKVD